ncbi:MAG: hypothetical protein PHU42_00160 [Patescibacteria group bacterium]|nr:hypothetical protein [Patescibacteria group bacterium]
MTKEEFVELHGEEAWGKFVEPLQKDRKLGINAIKIADGIISSILCDAAKAGVYRMQSPEQFSLIEFEEKLDRHYPILQSTALKCAFRNIIESRVSIIILS